MANDTDMPRPVASVSSDQQFEHVVSDENGNQKGWDGTNWVDVAKPPATADATQGKPMTTDQFVTDKNGNVLVHKDGQWVDGNGKPYVAPEEAPPPPPAPPPAAPKPPEQPGFFKRLGQSVGLPTSMAEYKEQAEASRPKSMADYGKQALEAATPGVSQAVHMILDTGKNAYEGAKGAMKEGAEAGQNIAEGGPIMANIGKAASGALHGTMQATPFVGPAINTAGEDIHAGNYRGAAGGLTGVIGQVAAPEVMDRMMPQATPATEPGLVGNDYLPKMKGEVPSAAPNPKPRIEYAEPTPTREPGLAGNEHTEGMKPYGEAKPKNPVSRIEYAEPTETPKKVSTPAPKAEGLVGNEHLPEPKDKEITPEEVKSTPGTSMSPEGKEKATGDAAHVEAAKAELGETAPTSKLLEKANELKEKAAAVKPIAEVDPKELADYHNENRGFTYNQQKGFMMGQPGFSVAGEHPEAERVYKENNIKPEQIKEYLADPTVQAALKADPRNSVGGWVHNGETHLEVSKLLEDKDEAIAEGKRLNQIEVFDHSAKQGIPTGGTGEAPKAGAKAEAIPEVKQAANDYNKENGLPELKETKAEKPAQAAKVADAFDEMKHDPNDPKVKASYKALIDDTKKQWDYVTKKMGIKIEPTDADPYKSEQEMFDDVKNNKTLKVFRGGNELNEGHPLAGIDPETGESYNTMFRAVHDLFGHIAQGNDFSEAGEQGAWDAHRQMMTPEAVPAMTTETKGQTSWFFNNEAVRNGEAPGKFAEQKAGLLPEEFYKPEGEAPKANEGTAEKAKESAETSPEDIQSVRNIVKDLGEQELIKAGSKYDTDHANYDFSKRDENRHRTERDQYVNDVTDKVPDDMKAKLIKAAEDFDDHDSNVFDNAARSSSSRATRAKAIWDKAHEPGFNPEDLKGKGPAPEATAKTARMSDEELLKHGFTREDIENGLHLPEVGGGAKGKAKGTDIIPEEANKHLTDEERQGLRSDVGRKAFVENLRKLPKVQEFVDIALKGEGGRKWYQRSTEAFKALSEEAPRYFQEGDQGKFTDFVASLSPQQTVTMNLKEALNAWTKYVDAGRPTGSALEQLLYENTTLPATKVPNAMKALAGEDLWPDISKSKAFKVPSFARNLRGYLGNVTSDGWQGLFGGVKASALSSPTSYHPLAVATRAAAEALGWEPAEAQAAIWAFTKAFTEHGETDPHVIRALSQDFADIMQHDPETRDMLAKLGVDHGQLDAKLASIGEKPAVTGRTTPTTENSVKRLGARIKAVGREIPKPKDQASIDFTRGEGTEPAEGSTEFDTGKLEEPEAIPLNKLYDRSAVLLSPEGKMMNVDEYDPRSESPQHPELLRKSGYKGDMTKFLKEGGVRAFTTGPEEAGVEIQNDSPETIQRALRVVDGLGREKTTFEIADPKTFKTTFSKTGTYEQIRHALAARK